MNTLINPKEFKMKINVGSIDRILRIIAGLALIALTATGIIGDEAQNTIQSEKHNT